MRIFTISREFGSGGRELGKRLADLTGYDYYDSEILSAVAQNSGMDARYVENALADHGWQNYPITFRGTFASTAYVQSSRIQLLLAQKRVIEQIAAMGKDCVIVGRNADAILQESCPFSLFVCADVQSKVRRCMERAPEGERLSERELISKMKQIDKNRAQTRALIGGSAWGERAAYHLTVNTTGWEIKHLVPAVADFAAHWFSQNKKVD